MDKADVVYTHNGILASYKKEWNPATCDNTGGSWRSYAKWSKSDGETQILYDFIHMWNLKHTHTHTQMNKIKQKQTHRYRDQISSYQRGKGLEGWVKQVKEVNCMVMDDNYTCGGDHFVVYTDIKL